MWFLFHQQNALGFGRLHLVDDFSRVIDASLANWWTGRSTWHEQLPHSCSFLLLICISGGICSTGLDRRRYQMSTACEWPSNMNISSPGHWWHENSQSGASLDSSSQQFFNIFLMFPEMNQTRGFHNVPYFQSDPTGSSIFGAGVSRSRNV